jgi:hypothetical protein
MNEVKVWGGRGTSSGKPQVPRATKGTVFLCWLYQRGSSPAPGPTEAGLGIGMTPPRVILYILAPQALSIVAPTWVNTAIEIVNWTGRGKSPRERSVDSSRSQRARSRS